MADEKRGADGGMLGRLAGRGEDAVTRLMDELGRNPRVTDALGRAMAQKGKVDDATRKTLGRMGLAASDELQDLRHRVDKLEQRLAKLETGTRARTATTRARTPATKSSGGTAGKRQTSTPRSRPSAGSGGSGTGGSRTGGSRTGGSETGGSGTGGTGTPGTPSSPPA
jgi:hypothetical protein